MYTKMCTFLLRRTYIISVRRRYDMKHIYMITEARVDNWYGVDFTKYDYRKINICQLEDDNIYVGVKKGDRVRIIAGRKNPIGTEGTVKWCGPNNFGYTFNDPITGREKHCDPSILLTLDDGKEVWTHGDVCINITNEGLDGIHEFESEKAADAWKKEYLENKPRNTDDVWVYENNQVHKVGYSIWGLASEGFSVYQGKIIETENEIAAVVDDFKYDVYYFVRFSKERKPDNLIKRVATGTHRNMDDMWRGDTGLGDALKAFEEFEKEVA